MYRFLFFAFSFFLLKHLKWKFYFCNLLKFLMTACHVLIRFVWSWLNLQKWPKCMSKPSDNLFYPCFLWSYICFKMHVVLFTYHILLSLPTLCCIFSSWFLSYVYISMYRETFPPPPTVFQPSLNKYTEAEEDRPTSTQQSRSFKLLQGLMDSGQGKVWYQAIYAGFFFPSFTCKIPEIFTTIW